MALQVCSLRQHDLDQVIRVERGSLLSVPQRGTPRSIVGHKYTLFLEAVNSKTGRSTLRPDSLSDAAAPLFLHL
jgi:hypothetical protein